MRRIIPVLSVVGLALLASCGSENSHNKKATVDPTTIKVNGTMDAELTSPPNVPAPVGDRPAKKLFVDIIIFSPKIIYRSIDNLITIL